MTKKLTSLALALVMCLSLCVPALAVETRGTTILRDNTEFRVAETIYEESRFVATYDKVNNVMTLEQFSLSTGEKILCTVSDFDEMVEVGIPVTLASSDSRNTVSGYSYRVTYGASNSWSLARPRYKNDPSSGTYSFMCNEMPSYATYLSSYRSSVNALSTGEKDLEDATHSKEALNCITLALASSLNPAALGIALGTMVAAMGFNNSAQSIARQIGDLQSDCLYYYEEARKGWLNYL